ncbi:hypothetical protein HYC85_010188 [Camellia sinensis]|uniref:Uncharacterized protein n=1 Tax=Camellia sinensis TaxID=4442 RepID=A0A7J7HJT8_CAMSI|nr:hypothetical protein HYC85_010188 [Camellia sinensis]
MATTIKQQEGQFPAQKQDTQPGKEHVMDPTPHFTNPDYQAANKLQVPFYLPAFFFLVERL